MSYHGDLRKKAKALFDRQFNTRFHFKKTFSGDSGEFVLNDLMKFSHANEDLYRPDIGVERYVLGQRSVILRIQAFLNMTDEQIQKLSHTKDLEE